MKFKARNFIVIVVSTICTLLLGNFVASAATPDMDKPTKSEKFKAANNPTGGNGDEKPCSHINGRHFPAQKSV